MKVWRFSVRALLLLGSSAAIAPAQEPVPIRQAAMPYRISAPGQYVIVEDLSVAPGQDGITVEADQVVLDFQGHTLQGPGEGSGHGVFQPSGRRRLELRNGRIVNWRGGSGVEALGGHNEVSGMIVSACRQGFRIGPAARVKDSTAWETGCGFAVERESEVESCTAYQNKGEGFLVADDVDLSMCSAYQNREGIRAGDRVAAQQCTSYENEGVGISLGAGAEVSGCTAYGNEIGFRVGATATVQRCSGYENRGAGMEAGEESRILGCSFSRNGGVGLRVASRSHVEQVACVGNAGAGIEVLGEGSRVERNRLVGNEYGLVVNGRGNAILGNGAVRNRVANYAISEGNEVGPILPENDERLSVHPNANTEL